MTYEEFLNFSGANPCPPPADAEEAIALPRGESEDVARLWVFRRRVGKYANINGRKMKIINTLSGGPDCPPTELIFEGGRSVSWSGSCGWILHDHGRGEWIPELSIYGERVLGRCFPSATAGMIDECLDITD